MDKIDRRLFNSIEAIYDAAPDPSLWPHALDQIASHFGDVGAILQWTKDDGTFGAVASDSLAEALRDYSANWADKDFKAQLGVQTGLFFEGEPVTDRHLAPIDDTYLKHPFNSQFLRKHGLGWFGSVPISPDPKVGMILSVQRTFDKPQFSDDELETIGFLGRHTEKAMRLSIRLLDAELANYGLRDALTKIGIGVLAVDSIGRLMFANPIGKSLIGELFEVDGGHLHEVNTPHRGMLDEPLSRAIRGDKAYLSERPKPLLLETPAGRKFVLYFLPIKDAVRPTEQFLSQIRAIVLAIEQKLRQPVEPDVVRDILQLTLGEARVAALVGAGLSTAATASRLSIKVDTARTVLKRVYAKTGISRQAELAALLSRLVLCSAQEP